MSKLSCTRFFALVLAATWLMTNALQAASAFSRGLSRDVASNQATASDVTVQADVQVTFDAGPRLYSYIYSFRNDPSSQREVDTILIPLDNSSHLATVLNVVAPEGWTARLWADGTTVQYGATEIGEIPPDFIDDGNVIPSPFQIRPGQTIGGFSFQSPNPPAPIDFFARGFTKLPSAATGEPQLDDGVTPPSIRSQSFKGTTTGPMFLEFDTCLQDDSNPGTVFLGNSVTGAYRFCCGGTTFTGVAQVTKRGNVVTFQHNSPNRRVLVTEDQSVHTGKASLQSSAGNIKCTIADRNTTNNSCACQ